MFAKAYGDDRLLSLAAEEADPGIKNILAGLQQAAPSFARARDEQGNLGDLDTASTIVDAIEKVREARNKRQSLDEVLRQQSMFEELDPDVEDVARLIDENIRSGKRLGQAFKRIAGLTEKYRTQGSESLFGDTVGKSDILSAARREIDDEQRQEGLFQEGQEPGVSEDSRRGYTERQRARRGRAEAQRPTQGEREETTQSQAGEE